MANDEWRTPEWVWEPYAPFDLDAAATAENTLAPRYITKEMDALTMGWSEVVMPPAKVWCNPPYSQEAGPLLRWVERGFEMRALGFRTFMLLPADTSTKWFHLLWGEDNGTDLTIDFLPRRVRHLDPITGKPGGSPKFGSLIVEFFPPRSLLYFFSYD